MTRYFLIIVLVLFSVSSFAQKEQSDVITTYYFIRHAEKDRTNLSEKDPHLIEEGHKRAQDWRNILQHIQFDAVYATDFNRTKETGQPTATKNGLEILTYSVSTAYDMAFKDATKGKNVLIVGHSNTIPDFVNAVIGKKKYKEIEDAVSGNLYIITIANSTVTDVLLSFN